MRSAIEGVLGERVLLRSWGPTAREESFVT